MDYSSNSSSNSFYNLNFSSSKKFDHTDYSSKESLSPYLCTAKNKEENISIYIKVLASWISEFADFNSRIVNSNSKRNIIYDNLTDNINEKYSGLKNLSDYNEEIFDPFFNPLLPEITMYTYLMRIIKLSEIECSTIIIACLYIDRLVNDKKYKVTWFNIYR